MSLSPSTDKDKEPNVETFAKRFLHFLTCGEHADIALIVGKDKIPIKAHKMLLILSSSYFEEKLAKGKAKEGVYSLLALKYKGNPPKRESGDSDSSSSNQDAATATGSSNDKQLDTFVIEDVEPGDLKLFLEFLYSRDAPEDIITALPLLMCATKFKVPSLIEAAGNLLKGSLTLESVLPVFQQALRFGAEDLQASALEFICDNAYKILGMTSFDDLCEEAVGLILQQDELQAYDEMQVFESAIRWARAECGRQKMDPTNGKYVRSVLDLLLKFIRFPLMNASEFPSKVGRLKILTTEERVDILEAFNTPEAQRFSEFFGTEERSYYKPKTPIQVVKLAQPSAGYNICALNQQSHVSFKVNKPIWLSEIGLSSLCSPSAVLPTSITIKIKNTDLNDDAPIVKRKESETVSVTGNYTPAKVVFNTPIQLKAETWYTISAFFNAQHQINCHRYSLIKRSDSTTGDDPICFEFVTTGITNNGQIAEIGYQLDD